MFAEVLYAVALLLFPIQGFADVEYPQFSSGREGIIYNKCAATSFMGTATVEGSIHDCATNLEQVCSRPENRRVRRCEEVSFQKCKVRAFETAGCQDVLVSVCNRTRDEWDAACDTLRYEQCLKKKFDGSLIVSTHPVEVKRDCKEVRKTFTLREIEKRVEVLESGSARDGILPPQTRPFTISDPATLEPSGTWENELCSLAKGDQTNPFWGYCPSQGGAPEPLPGSFTEISDGYEALKRKRVPEAQVAAFLKRVLDQTRFGPSESWDAYGASAIWLEEGESRNLDLRLQALRVLNRFGGDSFLTSFFLLEVATHGPSKEMEREALKGLAARRYPSGLVMLALIRALRDDDESVRKHAIRGLALRWNQEARGTYANAVGKPLEGLFPCPATLSARDLAIINRKPSMEEIQALPIEDQLCLFGVGFDLMRVRNDIVNLISQEAHSPQSLLARPEALEALAALSVEGERQGVLAFIDEVISERPHIDTLISALKVRMLLTQSDEQSLEIVVRETEDALESLARGKISKEHYFSMLDLLASFGKTAGLDSTGVHEAGNAVKYGLGCIQNSALPAGTRMECAHKSLSLASTNDRPTGPLGDFRVVEAALPLAIEQLRSPSYYVRTEASGLLTALLTTRASRIGGSRQPLMTQGMLSNLSNVLREKITEIFAAKFRDDPNLFSDILRNFEDVLSSQHWNEHGFDVNKAVVESLNINDAFFTWLEGSFGRSVPAMPVKSWIDRFDEREGDILLVRHVQEIANPQTGLVHKLVSFQASPFVTFQAMMAFAHQCGIYAEVQGPNGPKLKNPQWLVDIARAPAALNDSTLTMSTLRCSASKRSHEDIVIQEASGLKSALFNLLKSYRKWKSLKINDRFWGFEEENS